MYASATRRARRLCAEFSADKRGAVAIMFSIALFGVFFIAGIAIDYGRAAHSQQKIRSALDAATIAAAKKYKDDRTELGELTAFAQSYFEANALQGGTFANLSNFTLAVDAQSNEVTATVDTEVPTSFTRIAGITKISFPSQAKAVFNSQDLEIALQLDITGSMSERINGKRKITSLQEATRALLEILLPNGGTGTTTVRLGIAPFAAGVNAGAYASAVNGGGTDQCVYERMDASLDGTDDAPTGMARLKTRANLTGNFRACNASPIVPLTSNKAQLRSAVDNLAIGNATAGHLGTAWSWYLLSPKWSDIWPAASRPAAYSDTGTMKIAILMTDGLYNTVGGVMSNGNVAVSATKAREMCANMRAQNILIYSVAFLSPGDDPRAEETMRECGQTSGGYYLAQNGDEMMDVFRNIAQDISRLRLTH